jgi:TPR repeat protein
MLRIASLYQRGEGVGKDEEKAAEWIEKAAKAGNPTAALEMAGRLAKAKEPELLKVYGYLLVAASGNLPTAQNELALLYLSGNMGVADTPAAAAWFTRAAKGGLAAAQNNLASLYERGIGVAVNYNNAGELYTLAANQGHASATTSLARMTAQGLGTKQDLAKAWALASFASERGDQNAKTMLGELSPLLTPELLTSAKKILAEFKELEEKEVETREGK